MHAKDTLLFHKDAPWQKAQGDGIFDVTMGSHDGAETCELIGTYMLHLIERILPKEQAGLYRDDGMAILHMTPRQAENTKKELCKAFSDMGLKITAETNSTVVNFLDVTFNLESKSYKPYAKPGNNLLYVHAQSNHPRSVIKQIPKGIQQRLSTISSSSECFNECKEPYVQALAEAGHTARLEYVTSNPNPVTQKKKRRRHVLWFNPPYSQHVQTDVARQFLKLVTKHFPRGSTLHRLLNRNTVKVGYSCMSNMASIIKQHNNKVLNRGNNRQPDSCNCRDKAACPLPGKCTSKNVVYEATVTTEATAMKYIGLASDFKLRYNNHKMTFRNESMKHKTRLSNYIWDLKNASTPYKLTWRIVRKTQPYNARTKKCLLCLWEKFYIMTADKSTSLNARNELMSKCRHMTGSLIHGYG